jgi:hypothetical protein
VSSLAVAVPVIGNSERVVIFAVVLAGVAEVWRSFGSLAECGLGKKEQPAEEGARDFGG